MNATRGASELLARTVFALLVLGSFAAFFITQRLKHTPTPVQSFMLTPVFSPTPQGHLKQEQISFKIAKADEVTVTIVNLGGEEVATLVSNERLAPYSQLSLLWNGREGRRERGAKAPEGEYRVGVSLRFGKRTIYSPKSFELVRHVRAKG